MPRAPVRVRSCVTRVRYLQKLEKARSLFLRIARRDLYKLVDSNIIAWDDRAKFRKLFTPESIVQAVKAHKFTDKDQVKMEDVEALSAKDVIVDQSPMHYGMKDKNPLEFVRFYSKRSPNGALKPVLFGVIRSLTQLLFQYRKRPRKRTFP